MPAYFDSSVLLSLLVGDAHAQRARELWHEETERVSSSLLQVECTTVLRRLPQGDVSDADRRQVEGRLVAALDEVTIKPVDEDIAAIVRDTPSLGGCRALDAAHLATALYFRDAGDAALALCTFDSRMAEIGARVGLRLIRG